MSDPGAIQFIECQTCGTTTMGDLCTTCDYQRLKGWLADAQREIVELRESLIWIVYQHHWALPPTWRAEAKDLLVRTAPKGAR